MAMIVLASGLASVIYIEGFRGDLDWLPSQQTRQVEAEYRDRLRDVKNEEVKQTILGKAGISLERALELAAAGALIVDARPPMRSRKAASPHRT